MLLCSDDSVVVSDEAEDVIRNQIGNFFVVKKGYVGQPTTCRSVRKVLRCKMDEAWDFSSSQHVKSLC